MMPDRQIEPSWRGDERSESSRTTIELSDLELLNGIALGREDYFEILYDRYSPILYAICFRILKHEFDAREVLSEVFLEVWKNAFKFDFSRGSPRTFLVTMTRSRSIDRLRSNASKAFSQSRLCELWVQLTAQKSGAADERCGVLWEDERAALMNAMEGLSELQRQALCMAYFDGLTHAEIARKLGVPLGTAKTAIRRGIADLRDSMTDWNRKGEYS